MVFVIFQWLFTAFNMIYSDSLLYPYDLFGLTLDVTDSFGPRTWGCNLYQNLSAGINEKESDRYPSYQGLRITQIVVYGVVTLSMLLIGMLVMFPSMIGDGYGGKSLLFYIPYGFLILGALNLLISSYGQLGYFKQGDAKYSKQVSFDFIGTLSQIALFPRATEDGISKVWDVQTSFNFIFGLGAVCLLFTGFWYIVKIGGVDSSSIQKITRCEGGLTRTALNWSFLALVMVIYYGGFLSITVGAINNKYVGYPTVDGNCNKTYKKIDSISITPKTFTVQVVPTDEGNIKGYYKIDGNLTNDITLFRNSTYTFDLNDASLHDHSFLIGTSANNPYQQGIKYYLNGSEVSFSVYKPDHTTSNFRANGVIGSAGCAETSPCTGDRKLTFTVADDAPSELVIYAPDTATGLNSTRKIKVENF
tara:strand:- start:15817 stop:17073 length:1257 start_codon:yes stop_codon:yes gene_type:complete